MTDLKTALWCDLTTDEERSAWLLLGRGYETGVVAKSMQNDLARAYQRFSAPEPEYRDVVIKGDLWRIEFLPDHAASVVLVRANYEAQPEQEPVAWADRHDIEREGHDFYVNRQQPAKDGVPFYTAPPQHKEWQGLTENEKELLWDEAVDGREHFCSQYGDFADTIEAKLKDKNDN
jgi:hypothetical protein